MFCRKLEFSLNTTCFKSRKSRSSLFKPVPVKYNADDINVGKELTGELPKSELLNVISKFSIKPEIRQLALESGINGNNHFNLLFLRKKIVKKTVNNICAKHCIKKLQRVYSKRR